MSSFIASLIRTVASILIKHTTCILRWIARARRLDLLLLLIHTYWFLVTLARVVVLGLITCWLAFVLLCAVMAGRTASCGLAWIFLAVCWLFVSITSWNLARWCTEMYWRIGISYTPINSRFITHVPTKDLFPIQRINKYGSSSILV